MDRLSLMSVQFADDYVRLRPVTLPEIFYGGMESRFPFVFGLVLIMFYLDEFIGV